MYIYFNFNIKNLLKRVFEHHIFTNLNLIYKKKCNIQIYIYINNKEFNKN